MEFDWNKLTYYEREAVIRDSIYNNPYIPQEIRPHPKQALFLSDFTKEILYGGSAGGGKSAAMLMAALMFCKYPNYKALLLRRTFYQLTQPEALIPLSLEWLTGTDAKWKDKEHRWIFPNGSTLIFGYMDSEKDKYNYQGAAFHFIGFDELTQFTETMYAYLFSRLRKVKSSEFPLRMRASSNPGGIGHEWVKKRFITKKTENRLFIPAGLKDNPSLDADDYRENLKNLDPVTRKQLEDGDWDVVGSGNFFMRSKFRFTDRIALGGRVVRYWDMAGSDKKKSDFTVGVKMLMHGGQFYILDVIRVQKRPADVEALIKETAQKDGRHVQIYMEQEPGSAGLAVISHYSRNVLPGYAFEGIRSTGNKVDRAKPFSAAVNNDNVFLLMAEWNDSFLEECAVFPQEGFHDDQVDAASGAFTQLNDSVISLSNVITLNVDRTSKVCRGY